MGTAKIVSTSEIAAAQSFRHDQGSAGTTQRAERYRQIVNHFEQVARANRHIRPSVRLEPYSRDQPTYSVESLPRDSRYGALSLRPMPSTD